jgi:hypothetical protein
LSEANQLSATALSRHEPVRLIERRSPSRWRASMQAVEVYSLPLSLWKIVSAIGCRPRVATAASSAPVTKLASWWAAIE